MKAKVADWLAIKGTTIDRPDQRGLITEGRVPDGSPPCVARRLDNHHMATVFPGADAIVVTAAQHAAVDRPQRRFGSEQSPIPTATV